MRAFFFFFLSLFYDPLLELELELQLGLERNVEDKTVVNIIPLQAPQERAAPHPPSYLISVLMQT